jgi:hypothetical protein
MYVYSQSGARRRSTAFPLLLNRGLGAPLPAETQNIANIAATGAALTGTIIGLMAAIPVAGPIAAAIAGIGVAIANLFGGCGQTCVQATKIANEVGDALTQNLEHYMSAPVHYRSLQAAALNNFDTAWHALTVACSDPNLQDAGRRCISDRQSGACTWKASPGGWQQSNGSWVYVPWGPAGSGSACWNWFIGLRDPIADDPTVVPDPSPASIAGGLPGSVGGVPMSALLIPALIVGALWLVD